jgi:hypothetical protein
MQDWTRNGQETTSDWERASCNLQQKRNAADDKQGATCKAPLENVQQKIDDMQHAMGNMQQTTYSVQ